MNISDLPDLCTPHEAAQALRLYTKDGQPNPRAIKKLCDKGDLAYIKINKNNTVIERNDLIHYLRRKKCQAPRPSSGEKKETSGRSSGSSKANVNGAQQVQLAAEMLKESLQNSSSSAANQKQNVIPMKGGLPTC